MYNTVSYLINLVSFANIDLLLYFLKILIATKRLHTENAEDCRCFLSALYSKPLPNRGESVKVSFGTRDVR